MKILYYKSINKIMYSDDRGYHKVENQVKDPSTFSAKTKYIYFLSKLGYDVLTAGTKQEFMAELEQEPVIILTNNKISLQEALDYSDNTPILYIAANNYEISKVIEDLKSKQPLTTPIIFRRANDPIDTIFETIRFMVKSRAKKDLVTDDKTHTEKVNQEENRQYTPQNI